MKSGLTEGLITTDASTANATGDAGGKLPIIHDRRSGGVSIALARSKSPHGAVYLRPSSAHS